MTTSTTDSPRRRGPQLDEIRFWKMHGTGNDFVILDLTTTPEPSPELCSFLADRNIGVGCDLVLGVGSSRTSSAAAAFSIWTSTGVRSSQCGNGARCVARWLWEQGWVTSEWFQIESPSSTHNAALLPDGSVSIELGEPSLDSPRSIQVDDATEGFDLVPVWLGNPHAVIDLAAIGTVPLARCRRATRSILRRMSARRRCSIGRTSVCGSTSTVRARPWPAVAAPAPQLLRCAAEAWSTTRLS
jgi:diaminopimelate epimerase